MLDAANPLFGLVIRLRTLDDLPNIEYVHKSLQTQISAIREEIQQHGYPAAHLEAYSYALCLYVICEAGRPGKPVPPVTTLADYPPAIQERLLANADRWQLKPGRRPEKQPRKAKKSTPIV
nr:DotU family type IV/VI secretion system protein [Pseudomonas sp. UBA4617]